MGYRKSTQDSPIRIVLTWKGDLEWETLHVSGYSEQAGSQIWGDNEVNVGSFLQYCKNSKGELIAKWEAEKSDYYNIETITVYDLNMSFLCCFDYLYNKSNSPTSSMAEATVQVYKGESLITTYNTLLKYTYTRSYEWTVFRYDGRNGLIRPLGWISEE